MKDHLSSPKRKLFWPSEAKVRSVLEKIYDRVYAKVTLYDLVDPKYRDLKDAFVFSKKERDYIFNSAHADFVIVDQNDFPIFVLEVDGISHHDQKQMERDSLKNSILRKADIPIVRLNLKFFNQAQSQDQELRTLSSLELANQPIQTMIVGALVLIAKDQLILEYAKALYLNLRSISHDVDLWQWSKSIMRADSIRTFEKKWFNQATQHDTVDALLELNKDEDDDSLMESFQYCGHEDWFIRSYSLDRMYLSMIDRHIRSFIEGNGTLSGEIAAWYLLDETIRYTEMNFLVSYCHLVTQILSDFKLILQKMIDLGIENKIAEWLTNECCVYTYILPWGDQISLDKFYGYDRPGGGGITLLFDYIVDHDKQRYEYLKEVHLSSENEYELAQAYEYFGWFPYKATSLEACRLVIGIIEETKVAFSSFLDFYNSAKGV